MDLPHSRQKKLQIPTMTNKSVSDQHTADKKPGVPRCKLVMKLERLMEQEVEARLAQEVSDTHIILLHY